jgi:hypothetical protein
MSERQNQSAITQDQESPKKPYTNPQLTRHGTVVELTRMPPPIETDQTCVGSCIVTDALNLP